MFGPITLWWALSCHCRVVSNILGSTHLSAAVPASVMIIENISRHCQVPLGGKTKLVKNQCRRLAFPPSLPSSLPPILLACKLPQGQGWVYSPSTQQWPRVHSLALLEDLALTLPLCEGPGNTWEPVPWEEPRFRVWIKFWGLGLNGFLTSCSGLSCPPRTSACDPNLE